MGIASAPQNASVFGDPAEHDSERRFIGEPPQVHPKRERSRRAIAEHMTAIGGLAGLVVIDLFHYFVGFYKDGDDAAVVLYVVESQGATFAVFEPLLCGLVASNIHLKGGSRYALETLGGVDVDITRIAVVYVILPSEGINLHRARVWEGDRRLGHGVHKVKLAEAVAM